jgi:hypothetical protein
MTEPVTRISATRETSKKNAAETPLKHEKSPHHVEENEEDSVEISKEARERASGRKRKNILDYLNEEPG